MCVEVTREPPRANDWAAGDREIPNSILLLLAQGTLT
jgi:hypothetical protein